jgi:hypothetical protein
MIDLKALRDEFSTLHSAEEALIKKAHDEKRDFSAEEKTESENRFKRMDQIKAIADQQKKLAAQSFAAGDDNVELPTEPAGREQQQQVEINVRDRFDVKQVKRKDFARAFTEAVQGMSLATLTFIATEISKLSGMTADEKKVAVAK